MMATYAQADTKTKLDPRVLRTRQLLLDAFQELLNESVAIRDISIGAIAERAGVNRVTFYAHFADKYQLLEFWKRELFRQELAKHQLGTDVMTLTQVVTVVLDFMQYRQQMRRRINQQFEPLFEAAIQSEIQATLLRLPGVDTDTAVFLAWALFGSADHWSQHQATVSKSAMAQQLLQMVDKVLA